MSEGVGTHFAGADPHDLFDRRHPHLAVADLARARRLGDGVDHTGDLPVVDHDLHLDLRDEVDLVLGPAVDLGMSALPTEPLDLRRGQALHADLAQRLLDLVEPVRLHDGDDELHGVSRPRPSCAEPTSSWPCSWPSTSWPSTSWPSTWPRRPSRPRTGPSSSRPRPKPSAPP